MSAALNIRPATGVFVIRAGGAIIAESDKALEVTDGQDQTRVYFPPEDIAMALLEDSTSTTRCPIRGQARYFNISTAAGQIVDAAWAYDTPSPEAKALAGYIAFFPDRVTVERL